MSSVPFSIRLPATLVKLIEGFSSRNGMTSPDAVRAGIESAFSNAYRIQVMTTVSNPHEVLSDVKKYIDGKMNNSGVDSSLAREQYSALMHYWHQAYLLSSGHANINYVFAIMEIMQRILLKAEKESAFDISKYIKTLSVKADTSELDTLENIFSRIKILIEKNNSIDFAEHIFQSLLELSDDIQYLNRSCLENIFSVDLLEKAYPVAVLGSLIKSIDNVISYDMKSMLPTSEAFSVAGLDILFTSNPLTFSISEGHGCYLFKPSSLISLFSAIETGAIAEISAAETTGLKSIQWRTLHIGRLNDQVHINEGGAYRLILTVAEFNEVMEHAKKVMLNPAWAWMVNRHKTLHGDI